MSTLFQKSKNARHAVVPKGEGGSTLFQKMNLRTFHLLTLLLAAQAATAAQVPVIWDTETDKIVSDIILDATDLDLTDDYNFTGALQSGGQDVLTSVDIGSNRTATRFDIVVTDGLDLEINLATDTFAGIITAAEHALLNSALQSVAAADITDATADGIALITAADANPFTDADEDKLDGIQAASTTAQGTIEIATQAETLTLVDNTRTITPFSLMAALANMDVITYGTGGTSFTGSVSLAGPGNARILSASGTGTGRFGYYGNDSAGIPVWTVSQNARNSEIDFDAAAAYQARIRIVGDTTNVAAGRITWGKIAPANNVLANVGRPSTKAVGFEVEWTGSSRNLLLLLHNGTALTVQTLETGISNGRSINLSVYTSGDGNWYASVDGVVYGPYAGPTGNTAQFAASQVELDVSTYTGSMSFTVGRWGHIAGYKY